MKRVVVDDLAPGPGSGDATRRALSDPLATTDVAINHYRLAPDDRGAGLHAHGDQEEIFVVFEGEATIETLEGAVVLGSGEAVRFAQGEFHSGLIAGEMAVEALALGAPRDTADLRIPLECPECGHGFRRPTVGENDAAPVLICPECGDETSATCPDCGSDAMRAELAEDRASVVGVCGDCGVEAQA